MQHARGAVLASRVVTLEAAHQGASPAVRRGIAHGAEERHRAAAEVGPGREREAWLEAGAVRARLPLGLRLEHGVLAAAVDAREQAAGQVRLARDIDVYEEGALGHEPFDNAFGWTFCRRHGLCSRAMTRRLAAFALLLLRAGLGFAAEPPAFRLPDGATPLAYDARVAIDPGAERFSGEIAIRVRLERPTARVWLNATQLDIEAATVTQGENAATARIEPGGEDFVAIASTAQPFAAGEATIALRYSGRLDARATRGLFRQKEGEAWYVISQFESLSARRAFPCFDEPRWKTPWRLTIDAPAADTVASNTAEMIAYDVPERTGWRRHDFARTPPLPTYLVSLAVGPFDVVDGGEHGLRPTPLRYLAPRARAAEARFAREATPRLLGILEEYFGTPFPFEKLDAVAIPATEGFGAMENAGMITYSSALLLARAFEETVPFRRRYASVAAHEMAHQWFGDLVTLAWWDDTWLNEAFATWMADKALATYQPAWERGWWKGERRRRALQADRLAAARRVHNAVATRDDVWGAFDRITYDKGAEVLAMFEASLGPERFRAAVRAYLKAHAGGSATSAEFFAAVAEASGRREATLDAFRAFVEQPGAPLIDVALDCGTQRPALALVQQRLRPVGSRAPELRWTTPACFRYRADGALHEQCAEVPNGATRLELEAAKSCPDWVAANAHGTGHYVARYAVPTLQRLVDHVTELPEDEAVALAGDAALFARAGLISLDHAILLASTLLHHPAAGVKQGAVALLDALPDAWLDARERRSKAEVMARQLVPLAHRIGWVERARDGDDVRELRTALLPLAARAETRETLRMHARELALRWLVRHASIPAAIARPVLASAARFADGTTFARLEAALDAERDRRDRDLLVAALAAVRDPALRSRVLARLLDERLDGREALALARQLLEDEANRGAAFEFVRANFDALVRRVPPDSAAQLITPLAELCTVQDRDAFAAFFGPRAADLRGGAKRYAEALESIELCVAARAR